MGDISRVPEMVHTHTVVYFIFTMRNYHFICLNNFHQTRGAHAFRKLMKNMRLQYIFSLLPIFSESEKSPAASVQPHTQKNTDNPLTRRARTNKGHANMTATTRRSSGGVRTSATMATATAAIVLIVLTVLVDGGATVTSSSTSTNGVGVVHRCPVECDCSMNASGGLRTLCIKGIRVRDGVGMKGDEGWCKMLGCDQCPKRASLCITFFQPREWMLTFCGRWASEKNREYFLRAFLILPPIFRTIHQFKWIMQ